MHDLRLRLDLRADGPDTTSNAEGQARLQDALQSVLDEFRRTQGWQIEVELGKPTSDLEARADRLEAELLTRAAQAGQDAEYALIDTTMEAAMEQARTANKGGLRAQILFLLSSGDHTDDDVREAFEGSLDDQGDESDTDDEDDDGSDHLLSVVWNGHG